MKNILIICASFCAVGACDKSSNALPSHISAGASKSALSSEPWHLFGKNGINIIPAWEIAKGSEDVTIAIIDNGFLPEHAAFAQGTCKEKAELFDFVGGARKEGNHGAMVASLISTCENNPSGLIGINHGSKILWLEMGEGTIGIGSELFKWASGDNKLCRDTDYINCAERNNTPAIINFSSGKTSGLPDISRLLLLPAVEKTTQKGGIIIAAAGNEAKNAQADLPASATGVIAVGYTNKEGNASRNSNWGEVVHIMAPGEDIPVAFPGGKKSLNGSSLAAPIITGVVSLMQSVYPALNWKLAIYFLQSTATPMDCTSYCVATRRVADQIKCKKDCCRGDLQICTPGRVNAGAAVAAALRASREGLPPIALVDSDKYLVLLDLSSDAKTAEGSFTLQNLGAAEGKYLLTGNNEIVLSEHEVTLAPSGQDGDKQEILLSFKVPENLQNPEDLIKQWPIRVASPDSGLVSTFSDEIIIYAQPDISF